MNNTFCSVVGRWARRQLKQPSTYRGLVLLATAAGANISPEMVHSVVAVGASVAGLIDVLKNDEKQP